jgi:sulfhydrogenase subunit beta (sulfur reductase)
MEVSRFVGKTGNLMPEPMLAEIREPRAKGQGRTRPAARILEAADLQKLVDLLIAKGHRVVGPTVQNGAVVYDDIQSVSQLPVGWADEQEKGTYRLKRRRERSFFGYTAGAHSWKRFLFPPRRRLWSAESPRDSGDFRIVPEKADAEPMAFLGVRACEIAALAIYDRIFIRGPVPDPSYRARRRNTLIIAVQCGRPAATCFCASMGTGPGVNGGFDLALTELLRDKQHTFLIEGGTEAGEELLAALPVRPATEDELTEAREQVERSAAAMRRSVDTRGLKEVLIEQLDHPHWDKIASRCLSCANCTLACPTCFCHTVEDVTDLTGERAERWQRWDSCFNVDFSYIHGGSVRSSVESRYRQWLTHKFATWIDQFGTSGCVGCGRCITWCPAGIDVTEELRALREKATDNKTSTNGK